MTLDPLLLVLNPRRIPASLRSIKKLQIPKAWLTGYTERQLGPVISDLIATTDHTHYLVISDDVIAKQAALDAVLELLAAGHPVATGWCNLDATDPRINLGKIHGKTPTTEAYTFLRRADLKWLPDPVPTQFAGMCLTGMTRELWQRFPFGCYGNGAEWGYASDFHLCTRLRDAKIPIVAAKNAGLHHLKETWNTQDVGPGRELLIGRVKPRVRLDTAA